MENQKEEFPSLMFKIFSQRCQEDRIKFFLQAINSMRNVEYSPESFTVKYVHDRYSVDLKERKYELREECLGNHINTFSVMMYLFEHYPNEEFSFCDIERCLDIFKILVERASRVEDIDEYKSNVFYDGFNCDKDIEETKQNLGIYNFCRWKIWRNIISSPELIILCRDVYFDYNLTYEQMDETSFKLIDLLKDDNKFKEFDLFWNSDLIKYNCESYEKEYGECTVIKFDKIPRYFNIVKQQKEYTDNMFKNLAELHAQRDNNVKELNDENTQLRNKIRQLEESLNKFAKRE